MVVIAIAAFDFASIFGQFRMLLVCEMAIVVRSRIDIYGICYNLGFWQENSQRIF